VKIARAYLGQLNSYLPLNVTEVVRYYRMAIESHNPDGHYGMAQVLLQYVKYEWIQTQQQQQRESSSAVVVDASTLYRDPRVIEAIQHLEAAAVLDHAYSQFNLGMVHTYGYGTGFVNGTLAGQWFEASGLPEGYYLCSQQAQAVHNRKRYEYCVQRAHALGFTAPWRKQARDATGSGGAGGVSLNLPWPPAQDGRMPPEL